MHTTIHFKSPSTARLLVASTAEDSLQQTIVNIMTTEMGSRIDDPSLGSKLHLFHFRRWGEPLQQDIREEIRRCITQHEPRVLVDDIHVVRLDADRLSLTINYRMISQPNVKHQIHHQMGYAE